MYGHGGGGRLVVGLASIALLAGCAAAATPVPQTPSSPTTSTPEATATMSTPAAGTAPTAALPAAAAQTAAGAGPGVWRPVADMGTARSLHTASLLPDGRVLIAGGLGFDGEDPSVLASTELFDPTTGTWTPGPPMIEPRQLHTAVSLSDGTVLVFGGGGAQGEPLATVEAYDPATGSWTARARMPGPEPVSGGWSPPVVTRLADDRVLVSGGMGGSDYLARAAVYDPAADRWEEVAPMGTPRADHTATLLPDGTVLAVGGLTADPASTSPGMEVQLASAELFDPMRGQWVAVAAMREPRSGHTATLLPAGRVLVAGGGPSASAEVYEPTTRSWRQLRPMTAAREGHVAVALADGRILMIGGTGDWMGGRSTSVEVFDPLTETWTPAGSLSTPRTSFTATPLEDGRVLVAGSGLLGVGASKAAEVYGP